MRCPSVSLKFCYYKLLWHEVARGLNCVWTDSKAVVETLLPHFFHKRVVETVLHKTALSKGLPYCQETLEQIVHGSCSMLIIWKTWLRNRTEGMESDIFKVKSGKLKISSIGCKIGIMTDSGRWTCMLCRKSTGSTAILSAVRIESSECRNSVATCKAVYIE